jgi:hypothetical protein
MIVLLNYKKEHNLLQIELVVLLEYNDENLTRNFVQHSNSLSGAPH